MPMTHSLMMLQKLLMVMVMDMVIMKMTYSLLILSSGQIVTEMD